MAITLDAHDRDVSVSRSLYETIERNPSTVLEDGAHTGASLLAIAGTERVPVVRRVAEEPFVDVLDSSVAQSRLESSLREPWLPADSVEADVDEDGDTGLRESVSKRLDGEAPFHKITS